MQMKNGKTQSSTFIPNYVANNCCKDCTKRSPTCHGTCEEYIAYAKKCAEERKKRFILSRSSAYSKK